MSGRTFISTGISFLGLLAVSSNTFVYGDVFFCILENVISCDIILLISGFFYGSLSDLKPFGIAFGFWINLYGSEDDFGGASLVL